MAVFSEQPATTYNAYETELWSSLFLYEQALKEAIKALPSDCPSEAASSVLAQLKERRLEAISNSLKQSVADYGQDRLLLHRQAMEDTRIAGN